MSDLQQKAFAAADSAILDHGWPWELNDNGDITSNGEKARAMLAMLWTQGFGVGLDEMHGVTERVFAEIAEGLR